MGLIARLQQGLASRWRIARYRAAGVRIEGHIRLQTIEIPHFPSAITLQDGAALDRGVVLLATNADARIVIGLRTYLNRNTILDASELIEVGAQTMIGPFCYITDHDHSFGADGAPAGGALITAPTRLEPRCWIGAHVSILKGVTVGKGSVVGAGSVVTKSLPAGVIAVGNPARILRQRAP